MPRLSSPLPPRERLSFNAGWKFFRGDAPDAGDTLVYDKLRPWILATGAELINQGVAANDRPARPPGDPGAEVSFVQRAFDDAAWRTLDLPHDWGIEGPFAQDLPGETGKLPWSGPGWYRKRFTLSPLDAQKKIALEIDGAMAFSSVWLNEKFLGGWPYGYSSFRLDLTPHLEFGGAENVLVVRLDNPPNSSRWYPGSGLYRNVWLAKTNAVRVAPWGGVFVSTPRIERNAALVNADVTLENLSGAEVEVTLRTRVHELTANGMPAVRAAAAAEPVSLKISAGKQALRSLGLRVPRPKLWSLERRTRYVAITSVEVGGVVVDRVETVFGIRTIRFDADDGFHLNGRRIPIRGVCMHHDLGALGTALNVRALERQLEILQSMGCNALRTSHNPPAPELLELCDRMGFVVMVEAFDCWRRGKKWPAHLDEHDPHVTYLDYARVFDDWHERDLRAMVRRDRNHPCVVLWSIGNEVMEQWIEEGWKMAAHLAGIVREEDRTRPVTAGLNNEQSGYIGFQTALDVVAFNYKPREYGPFHRRNPAIPTLGSETSSCISTRGEYFFPVEPENKFHGRADFQVSSYDLSTADWAVTPDGEFRGLDEHPFAAGEFVWTGFDYLGEPTPYNADTTNLLNFSDPAERERVAADLARLGRIAVPSRSSYFGIVDLAGFPKDRFHLYQARWRPELRFAHILPHWNWPERAGQVTPVHVYSSADEAELFLNGKSQGRRKRKPLEYRFRWDDVVYAPGELRVVTWKRGKKWATATRSTAGLATRVALAGDRKTLRADGRDLAFVTATLVDDEGRVVPRTRYLLNFSVIGPGEIVATDNGDPTSHESFQSTARRAFNGMALAIIRTRAGARGPITLRAESDGLKSATLKLTAK